ncbi:hypothetical protein RHGRI_003046 [Rhododendron griersonianum]|uniref:Uncharacterized protein n=1 Tax=Rhododendron griersonianum TaxID=479676 RepID=A0AAV6LRX1_9ERIC|nr:hypothetical protein RHGRI_003046 [Rhododendron griersonianum]
MDSSHHPPRRRPVAQAKSPPTPPSTLADLPRFSLSLCVFWTPKFVGFGGSSPKKLEPQRDSCGFGSLLLFTLFNMLLLCEPAVGNVS